MVYWDQRGIGESLGKIEFEHLNRLQYLEDLEKLIELLKYRYGNDIELFLMGHSWGGVLGQSYLVKHSDEEIIKGWIEIGSFHSVKEMKKFGKERLIMIANEQIQKGKSIEKWKNYIEKANQYCADCSNSYKDLVNFFHLTIPAEEQADKDGELKSGIDASISYMLYRIESIFDDEVTIEDSVISDYADFDITNELYKITVPSLFIFGKYDIHLPIELAYQAKEKYGTPAEDFYIKEFLYSDHSPMSCEPELFQECIIKFVNRYKTNE
jgi:pimeloyl-ACP methyl ester carboxylesterase